MSNKVYWLLEETKENVSSPVYVHAQQHMTCWRFTCDHSKAMKFNTEDEAQTFRDGISTSALCLFKPVEHMDIDQENQ